VRYSPTCGLLWPRVVYATNAARPGVIVFVVEREGHEFRFSRPNVGRTVVGLGVQPSSAGCVYVSSYVELDGPFHVTPKVELDCITTEEAPSSGLSNAA
jgi:hypothetical protein